jgi:hypothetical protein
MSTFKNSVVDILVPKAAQEVFLVTSGDLRLAANQECWPAQYEMEHKLIAAFAGLGKKIIRAHSYNPVAKHGFISSQRMGMDIFKNINPVMPVIVAEAVWQYSHHVLAGLRSHRGAILTVANWSGQWPGLVGLLNLNASLTKMGVNYSTIWSKDFNDDFFIESIKEWLETGYIKHDVSHVKDLNPEELPEEAIKMGKELSERIQSGKVILGIFDEGCMGMYNAIIDDELLNPLGVYKERLSQSALVAGMKNVSDQEAQQVRKWLDNKGMKFVTGRNEETELTERQILEQLKMYITAVRIAHEFGCDAIGIQYQQGLKDMAPASDLAEGLLNNIERPPVFHDQTGEELYPGKALPHFNEVDEGAAVDSLFTNHVWSALGINPAVTLHDIRWGEEFSGNGIDDFVWTFMISGAVPASHLTGGYSGAVSERQPPMYFRLGGGTLKGVSKPGEIVWSRLFIMNGELHIDMGRGTVVELPKEETERRWKLTTPQWPIMHAILHGIKRDQMMARHKANHLNVVYAPSAEVADKALSVKAAMFHFAGVKVHLCGNVNLGEN